MEPMIRGYAVPLSARFLLREETLRPGLPEDAVEKLTRTAASKAEIWLPRREAIYIWNLIADTSPDAETAYTNLVRCGDVCSHEAINTFLKLLLRVLSPKQFVRKFPEIWSHEHKGGYVEAMLTDPRSMVILIRDVEGFPHVGPVATGFVGTALRALGLKDLKIRDVTWTRERPDPRDARLEISWS